jgi:hypothetical protein
MAWGERVRMWTRTSGHPLAAASLIAVGVELALVLPPVVLPGFQVGPCVASLPAILWGLAWSLVHIPGLVAASVVSSFAPEWVAGAVLCGTSLGLSTMAAHAWIMRSGPVPWWRRREHGRCAV